MKQRIVDRLFGRQDLRDEVDGEAECLACGKDCKGQCDYRYESARDDKL